MAEITQHQKDQLLSALMYYLGPDTRRKIMDELPQAYNAWFGREIMAVTNTTEAATDEDRLRTFHDVTCLDGAHIQCRLALGLPTSAVGVSS